MYRSDKTLTQDLFFPFQLLLLALESIRGETGEKLAHMVKEAVTKHVAEYRGRSDESIKFIKRCERLSHEVILDLADHDKISGHKFVLVLHRLAEMVIEKGCDVPEMVIELFRPFLEIEHNNPISDEDWNRLKKSAEKQANRLLVRLNERGYFIN